MCLFNFFRYQRPVFDFTKHHRNGGRTPSTSCSAPLESSESKHPTSLQGYSIPSIPINPSSWTGVHGSYMIPPHRTILSKQFCDVLRVSQGPALELQRVGPKRTSHLTVVRTSSPGVSTRGEPAKVRPPEQVPVGRFRRNMILRWYEGPRRSQCAQ